MKTITIETIEKVAGRTIKGYWKSPMYRVNGKYIASSIYGHNLNGKEFDLKVGETVEVLTEPDRKYPTELTWIARANKGEDQ